MLRLKVGKNTLLTLDESKLSNSNTINSVAFMSAFLKGSNVFCLDVSSFIDGYKNRSIVEKELKEIVKMGILDITFLVDLENVQNRSDILFRKAGISYIDRTLKKENELIKIKVITINKYKKSLVFLTAREMIKNLELDERWLASKLEKIPSYKEATKRSASINEEIQVIDKEIKKIQDKKNQDTINKVSFNRLKKMKLFSDVQIASNGNLSLTINPMHIIPSEPLGRMFRMKDIEENKYLYNAIKYNYLGYKFLAPSTIIEIDKSFSPKVVEVVDKRFINLLEEIGWGGPGYCHFGLRAKCLGEFSSAVSGARDYGIEYYLLSLKQYITTANVNDSAGCRVWAWPLVDENNNIVYSALLDNVKHYYTDMSDKSYDEILDFMVKENSICASIYSGLSPATISYCRQGQDNFLILCEKREPEIYNILKEKGVVQDDN